MSSQQRHPAAACAHQSQRLKHIFFYILNFNFLIDISIIIKNIKTHLTEKNSFKFKQKNNAALILTNKVPAFQVLSFLCV